MKEASKKLGRTFHSWAGNVFIYDGKNLTGKEMKIWFELYDKYLLLDRLSGDDEE